jgi:glyoxylase-like metal-dependent hydrolase (beta-lactamase superfamily II)
MFKTILKVVGAVIGLFVLVIGLTIGYIFGLNQKPRSGPALGHGIEQIADSITTIYLFQVDGGKIVLIDAGNDPTGAPILAALKNHGKTADDVEAIFIIHAHPDHEAAVNLFTKAKIYAMKDEVDIASGKQAYNSPLSSLFGKTNPHPFQVTDPLTDQQSVTVGGLQVTAYEVSGHTPGSAVYLADGVLFLGDAAGIGRNKKIRGPIYLFSTNAAQGIANLGELLKKLAPRMQEIEFVTSSHSGTLPGPEGIAALQEFVAAHQAH